MPASTFRQEEKVTFSLKGNEQLNRAPTSHALSRNQQFGLGSARQFFCWACLGSLTGLQSAETDRLSSRIPGGTGAFSLGSRSRTAQVPSPGGDHKSSKRGQAPCTRICQVSACFTFVIGPLAKPSPMANPRFKGSRNKLSFLT